MNPAGATTKGESTRAAILDAALRIVSKAGLDGLTIGTLADATGMSKSGLFAHFGSREELLLAVLAHGQAAFTELVFQPAMAKPRGIARLKAMFINWLDWTESAIAAETGPLRAIGKVVHAGKRVATAAARLGDPSGKLYAHASSTCIVL